MLRVVPGEDVRQEFALALDEICRRGAERMLAVALEAEVDTYLERHRAARDDAGHALVVRNGHARPRTVVAGAGTIDVIAPRVDDRRTDPATGERSRFRSSIVPPYARRSPKVAEVLPLLYLHGLSTKDFVPALTEFFGTSTGLSAPAITRLTANWSAEREVFMNRDLSEVDYVYCWVDGVHFTVRLGDDDRLCVLVMVGVRTDGTKELVALADGYRESTESWADLLRDCRRRGMRAPVLAVGDGALGFWTAARDVFPETRHQRDWVHKAANILNALPASVQAPARRALREIWDAEDKRHAERALDAFVREFAKWPKAVARLTKDREAVLAFYDFPAEHWIHLRTSNPIESTFSPVRARTDVTKGPGSRNAGLAMCFKLIEAAEGGWRRVNAPELVALVRAGAKFVNGRLVERTDQEDAA
ncbi:MAG TPA: IS256 family transposase [Actinomycetota bacterium]|nr:IS256 family transposase [Actinomycetota bacterium]